MYLLITSSFRTLFFSVQFPRDEEKTSITYVHIPWNNFLYADTLMTGVNFDFNKIDCLIIGKTFFELYFRVTVLEVGVNFLPVALFFFCCDPVVKSVFWCQLAVSEIQHDFWITAFHIIRRS